MRVCASAADTELTGDQIGDPEAVSLIILRDYNQHERCANFEGEGSESRKVQKIRMNRTPNECWVAFALKSSLLKSFSLF
eukprot:SAG11_NODE_32_length_22830_cov_17.507941_13_plen_80_part_00